MYIRKLVKYDKNNGKLCAKSVDMTWAIACTEIK